MLTVECWRAVAETHDQVQTLLAHEDVRDLDEAVARLSRHLAAAERVLYPAAERLLPDSQASLHANQARTRQLERELRLLQQRLNGDMLAQSLGLAGLQQELGALVAEHKAHETKLLNELRARVNDAEWAQLLMSWQTALEHAPTRPHPHAPHAGLAERIAFGVEAWWDRLLDTADARPVPRKPRAQRREVGPWGRYLLGG